MGLSLEAEGWCVFEATCSFALTSPAWVGRVGLQKLQCGQYHRRSPTFFSPSWSERCSGEKGSDMWSVLFVESQGFVAVNVQSSLDSLESRGTRRFSGVWSWMF